MTEKFKLLCAASIIAVLLISCFCVMAYDGNGYSINVPENYQKQNNDNADIWVDASTSNTVSVIVAPNTTEENYKNATQEDANALIPQMRSQLESEALSYGEDAKVDVKNLTNLLTVLNGYDVIVWDIEMEMTISGDTITTFQKVYSFTGKNNIYTVTFTHHDSAELTSEEKGIISGFVINDELFTEATKSEAPFYMSPMFLVLVVAAAIIILVLTAMIIILVKTNK